MQNLACRVVTAPLDRCLATLTGNPSITIQLIASYALDIFEFLKTNINFTSLKFFFERIEKAVDPKVITSNLTCSCPRPQTNTSGFPWTCQATSSPSIARKTCECINANEDDAFCEIRIDCPVSHPLAVGGRCDNDVQQKTERFHFEDVGFGNPNVLGIPSYTTCNVEVSRLVDQVTVNAYAYCKAI